MAVTGTVQLAKGLWKPEFCWKDISRIQFTGFQQRDARSSAEPMKKGQVVVGQGGSRWRYRKNRFTGEVGREGDLLGEKGIPGLRAFPDIILW